MSLFSDKTEKDYERQLIRRLKKYGFASHIECSILGFPDIIYLSGKTYKLIEVKRKINTLRSSQKAFHEILRKHNCDVYTVYAENKEFTLYKNNELVCIGTVDQVMEKILDEKSV